MELLAEAGADLVIAQGDVSVTLPTNLIRELSEIGDNFQFSVVTEAAPVAGAAAGVSIRAAIDGVSITSFASPVTVVVYLGNLAVTWSNPNNLVAVRNPVIQGSFSATDNTFTFEADEPGDYIITDDPDPLTEALAQDPPFEAAPPAAGAVSLRFAIGSATYTRNGMPITDPEGLAPFIDPAYNRTMVPLRIIAEALGAQVDWIAETSTVVITQGARVFDIPVDYALPDGMGRAAIVNERTFVPLAYVSQMLGADVRWDGDAAAVYIQL